MAAGITGGQHVAFEHHLETVGENHPVGTGVVGLAHDLVDKNGCLIFEVHQLDSAKNVGVSTVLVVQRVRRGCQQGYLCQLACRGLVPSGVAIGCAIPNRKFLLGWYVCYLGQIDKLLQTHLHKTDTPQLATVLYGRDSRIGRDKDQLQAIQAEHTVDAAILSVEAQYLLTLYLIIGQCGNEIHIVGEHRKIIKILLSGLAGHVECHCA